MIGADSVVSTKKHHYSPHFNGNVNFVNSGFTNILKLRNFPHYDRRDRNHSAKKSITTIPPPLAVCSKATSPRTSARTSASGTVSRYGSYRDPRGTVTDTVTRATVILPLSRSATTLTTSRSVAWRVPVSLPYPHPAPTVILPYPQSLPDLTLIELQWGSFEYLNMEQVPYLDFVPYRTLDAYRTLP